MQKHTRSLTPEEIADIVAETVMETTKDLNNLAQLLRMVSETTVQVMQALQGDKAVRVEDVRSRSLRHDAIVWRVVTKLRETGA